MTGRSRPLTITRAMKLLTAEVALATAISGTATVVPAAAATAHREAVLEWLGPHFQAVNDPLTLQKTDDPVLDIPFRQPRAAAARRHDGRDVVYVLDAGNNRIQGFEVNAVYEQRSQHEMSFAGGPVAGEFGTDRILPPEYAAVPTRWIVPGSELLYVEGEKWTRVENLTGYTTADRVYVCDYARGTDEPEIELPAGALSSLSRFEMRYLISDYQDGGAPAFGLGDVDYGVHHGGALVHPVLIDETSGGPASWQYVRALALCADPADTTRDVLYLLDSADDSGSGNEKLFSYSVDLNGTVSAGERYGDWLNHPYGICIAEHDQGRGASAWIEGGSGPFDATADSLVADADQVTGHDYLVTVAADTAGPSRVTVLDTTIGRLLVASADSASLHDPFFAVPGLALPLRAGAWSAGNTTVHTRKASPGRFLFVADAGADRIKILGLPGSPAAGLWTGDWLPCNQRRTGAQPAAAGAVGAAPGFETRPVTPAVVGEHYWCFTATAPLSEGSLATITFDPDGTAQDWRRVDDVETAGPLDRVYSVDWTNGRILFGDGLHGSIPPASTPFDYAYATTPDVIRFGTSGTGEGRFASPRGVAARWNEQRKRFDLYVADTANDRIQKLAFFPEDTTRRLPPRIYPVAVWSTASGGSDPLRRPTALDLGEAGSGRAYLAVSEPGQPRVTLFRDESTNPDGVPPFFEEKLGGLGNVLGSFVDPEGIAFLRSADCLDLYVADESRGKIVKYSQSPVPTIDLLFVGESALPDSFPPYSGYTISFETDHAPLGGWVDFYFDTSPVYDARTSRLCLPQGRTPSTATSAFWSFKDSPGGPPPDGTYYIFAHLKDPSGNTVAVDQSTMLERITIDSSLLTTLRARDAMDGDRTLYLQNDLERQIRLDLLYPDSTSATAFGGSFDTSLVHILSITPGTAFDGLGATEHLFTSDFDNQAGTFHAVSSVTGAPIGLLGKGPHTIAMVRVQCRPHAITPASRVRSGVFALDRAACDVMSVSGQRPPQWTTASLRLRAGYLGDIATTGSGADSVLPALQPCPDGKIDFEDQMVFTLAWNGVGNVRDPIADLGPALLDSPDLLPVPDRRWDVDDIAVYTSQASYFGYAGWNGGGGSQPRQQNGSGGSGHPLALGATASSRSPENPISAECFDLGSAMRIEARVDGIRDLMGADLRLCFDPRLEVEVASGGFLEEEPAAQVLALKSRSEGAVEISLSRLSQTAPGVSGSGMVAVFTLEDTTGAGAFGALSLGTGTMLRLDYDLRNTAGRSLGFGELTLGDDLARLAVPCEDPLSAAPNPCRANTRIGFGLVRGGPVRVSLFDSGGRRVRTLFDGTLPAGAHGLVWDGADDAGRQEAVGIYFVRLEAGERREIRKVTRIR